MSIHSWEAVWPCRAIDTVRSRLKTHEGPSRPRAGRTAGRTPRGAPQIGCGGGSLLVSPEPLRVGAEGLVLRERVG